MGLENIGYGKQIPGSEFARYDFARRNQGLMARSVALVLEERINPKIKPLVYEPIVQKTVDYLGQELGNASKIPMSWQDIDYTIKETYLGNSIHKNLGNLEKISRESGYSSKQLGRIIQKNDYLKDMLNNNRPGNFDPREKRSLPNKSYFNTSTVYQALESALETTLDAYKDVLNSSVGYDLKKDLPNATYELTDRLNNESLVVDLKSKVSDIALETINHLSKTGNYSLKDTLRISKEQVFMYIFYSAKKDFKKTAEILDMSERNARRLHETFANSEKDKIDTDDKKAKTDNEIKKFGKDVINKRVVVSLEERRLKKELFKRIPVLKEKLNTNILKKAA